MPSYREIVECQQQLIKATRRLVEIYEEPTRSDEQAARYVAFDNAVDRLRTLFGDIARETAPARRFEARAAERWFDRKLDCYFPWYTRPCLEWLISKDWNGKRIFEYGAGDSTVWWRRAGAEVYAVDSNQEYATRFEAIYAETKRAFLSAINAPPGPLFYDLIAVDGDPISWRDDCVAMALPCVREGGYLLVDNWHQPSVGEMSWVQTDHGLAPYERESMTFVEEGHSDWTTKIWEIR